MLIRLKQFLSQLTEGHRNTDKIQESIREGTDINFKNKANRTAVSVAAENGCLDAVSALIAAKADIEVRDHEDKSVLHLAAKAGNAELVRALLNSKADLNAKDKAGKTPFDLATSNDECKYALKKMGAGGWTALMAAAESGDDRVKQYFYLRHCILCMTPTWSWTREICCKNVVLNDKGNFGSNDSGYFCALGSDEFVGWGVHTWEISIESHSKKYGQESPGACVHWIALSYPHWRQLSVISWQSFPQSARSSAM